MTEPARKIPIAMPMLSGREREYVLDCIDTVWISSIGKYISRFEEDFADFLGVRNAISVSNGTVALHAALLGLGVQPGDEVIVPTLTYVATANAVAYCGAKPVFVDSDPRTFNIDATLIERAITPKTRGIIPVDLYGHPVDAQALREIAAKRGLFILEDAAEALGASAHGKPAGALGDCATFSFFGNKTITTGEGGMIVTDDDALAEHIRRIKGQGMDPQRRYWFPEIGYNYRMTNVAAAIGVAQLECADQHIGKRRTISGWYDELLSPYADRIRRPVEEPWAKHSYWIYTIALEDAVGAERDAVMAAMSRDGVETRPVFYPMHVMPVFREPDGTYPVAEWYGARGISLPTHGHMTAQDAEYVVETLIRAL